MAKVCIDTNIILEYPEVFENEEFESFLIPSAVLEELDRIKTRDGDLGYRARRGMRLLEEYDHKIEYEVKDIYSNFPDGWDTEKRDNKIVLCARDNDVLLLSNDANVRQKAKAIKIKYDKYGDSTVQDRDYKGWKEISGTTEEINSFYQKFEDGEIEFLTNEYLIVYNTETKRTTEQRFDGKKLVDLSLPPSKIVKGLNAQQRCALDLLYNKDIPIKVINGSFGSGKTIITTKVGLHQVVDKGVYGSLTYLRNPIVADGTEIGFLKGSKEDKIREYMAPLLQYVESEKNQAYAEMLIKNEQLKLDVISFLKGVNIDDSFVVCDEAEDLNVKLIKLIGSRIAKKSCIVFTGDYKQAENKYKSNNGLLKLINETKGNPLVGIVNLPEDLRSSASKVFADL